jgi:hypothetical protein
MTTRTTLLLTALALALAAGDGEAGRRRAKASHDHRPATRAEVAAALEPLLDRQTLARPDGRVITGQDVANLESVAIDASDEMATTGTRVENLTAQIEQLRQDIQDLGRRRRR